jgi:hypothetical protein
MAVLSRPNNPSITLESIPPPLCMSSMSLDYPLDSKTRKCLAPPGKKGLLIQQRLGTIHLEQQQQWLT